MVGIQYEVIGVGHLGIEPHALLEVAHFLHAAHILVLCDENRLEVFSERLDIHHELRLGNGWDLRAESL